VTFTETEKRILGALAAENHLWFSSKEIAEEVDRSVSFVRMSLPPLVAQGWLEFKDAHGRRYWRVTAEGVAEMERGYQLTPRERAFLRWLREQAALHEGAYAHALAAEDQAAMDRTACRARSYRYVAEALKTGTYL